MRTGVQVEAYRRDILRDMRDKQLALQGSIADIVSQLEESQVAATPRCVICYFFLVRDAFLCYLFTSLARHHAPLQPVFLLPCDHRIRRGMQLCGCFADHAFVGRAIGVADGLGTADRCPARRKGTAIEYGSPACPAFCI